jgi:ATP/ADP translocase
MTKTFVVVFSFDAAIVTRVARIVVVTFLRPAGRIVRRRRTLVVVVVVIVIVGQTAAVIVIITTVNQIKSNQIKSEGKL